MTQANVMIHSRHFQVYDIRLRITAEFSGLRYMVYNYPGTFLAFSLVMNITVLVWVMFGLITGIFLHGMAA